MTFFSNLIRSSRRQIHTIISKEIIKPSLPTPSHLKTYNLSLFDQMLPSVFAPLVTFYPKAGIYDQTLYLKNSLSQALTKYYPFAGRHSRIAPSYVDCNDHGAEFVEASVDRNLAEFLQSSQHEDLDRLCPNGRTWRYSNTRGDHDLQIDTVIPLAVQVNHFECGGVAVAVSLSHKIADASSLIHFVSDWAKVTRGLLKQQQNHEVPNIEPHFISFEKRKINFSNSFEASNDCVTKSFMFPNTKINELKLKVAARSGVQPITNPTRVEVLTWLLYKCSLAAATKNNSGSFKPTCILVSANLRDKMITEPLPKNCIGNFMKGMEIHTMNETELTPELIIGELRKQKTGIRDLKNIEEAFAPLLNIISGFDVNENQRKIEEDPYVCTSICGFSAYKIDFGWGSPIKTTIPGKLRKNSFIIMDAPNQAGIEVLVCLGNQDMDIIQRDPELLAFS